MGTIPVATSHVQITNSLGMKFNLIPPGGFMMGSPTSEWGRRGDETQHRVKITKPFYMSVHEVTQSQYERMMGKNPSHFSASGEGSWALRPGFFSRLLRAPDTLQFPVEQVSWNDAVEFCNRLSKSEGVEYRLPTEAEWEYACRAGATTAYSFGDDERQLPQYAWYKDNFSETTHPVGELKPNAWGLFDMHGNVWEWCQDWYGDYDLQVVSDPTGPASGIRRVLRGGAFSYRPRLVRAAIRYNSFRPDGRSLSFGFRLARTYPLSP